MVAGLRIFIFIFTDIYSFELDFGPLTPNLAL